jgi:hypothetical protein
LLGVQPQDARRFHRPVGRRKRRSERERHLAEYCAWRTPTEGARDSIEQLHDFNLSGNHRVKCPLVAFMNGKFAGGELDVGGGFRETLKIGCRYRRKYWDGLQFVDCKHRSPDPAFG